MKRSTQQAPQKQVVRDHVRELRWRLLIVLAVFGVVSGGSYFIYAPILAFLRSPLHTDLYYSTPAGSFGFVMKICVMVGVAVALPVLIYQIIMFLRPAFERILTFRRVAYLTIMSVVLAAGGAAFGFYAILPSALHFFGGFAVSGLSPLISADSYLRFVTNVIITFAVVFQLPLLISLFNRLRPIPPRTLLKMETYVVLAGIAVSIIVPFAMDITTCILIAAPIVVLYNLSVAMIMLQRVFEKRRRTTPRTLAERELIIDEFILEEMREISAQQTVSASVAAKVYARTTSPTPARAGMDMLRVNRQALTAQRAAQQQQAELQRAERQAARLAAQTPLLRTAPHSI